ncbi:MAG: ComEA family DNA-binding protein [Fidelibacterota bacterium]
MLFTPREKLVLQFILTVAGIGLITGIVRRSWTVDHIPMKISHVKKPVLTEPETKLPITAEKATDDSLEIVNINIANIDELTSLPNIGPVAAQRIIAYREQYGEFKTVDEIQRVKGIGAKTYAKILSRISVK